MKKTYYEVKKFKYVGEKTKTGNPDYSEDTPEKQVNSFSNNSDLEMEIIEHEFEFFNQDEPDWKYSKYTKGYIYIFKKGTYSFIFMI